MFNDNLSYYRKKKLLTQEELANLINVSRSTIALYERGYRKPDEAIINQLCSVLEVSYDELMYFDINNPNNHIPYKFRRLREKEVVKFYGMGGNKFYIIHKIHNDYLEAFNVTSQKNIYFCNIRYDFISYYEYPKDYLNCVNEFLKFDLDEVYKRLHLDYDIYKMDISFGNSMIYAGSFKNGKITVRPDLLPRGMYKIFLEEGFFKAKKGENYSYSIFGEKIDRLKEEPKRIDILLDSDEPIYHLFDLNEEYYKLFKKLNDKEYVLYTYKEKEGLIVKKDDISKYHKIYLIPRSFKENENKINLKDISL